MQKIDGSEISLDLQSIILTGMNFAQMCEYIATHVLNNEEDEDDNNKNKLASY